MPELIVSSEEAIKDSNSNSGLMFILVRVNRNWLICVFPLETSMIYDLRVIAVIMTLYESLMVNLIKRSWQMKFLEKPYI